MLVVKKDFLGLLNPEDGGSMLLWSTSYCVQVGTAKYTRSLQTYISYLFIMSRPQFHLPPLGSLTSWRTWRHLVTKVGRS